MLNTTTRFLPILALCLTLAVGTAAPALAEADTAEIGVFTVTTAPAPPPTDTYVVLDIRHNGAPLPHSGDIYREAVSGTIQADFPKLGCRTMQVELFTGGANCCQGYYVLTDCDGPDYAVWLEPGDFSLNVTDALGALAVDDPSFMYYSAEAAGAKLAFSRPESPRLHRLLTFDNGAWRADKPGEYQGWYSREIERVRGDNPAARAVQIAYYRFMRGENPESVTAAFKRDLPDSLAPLADIMLRDIERAVLSFQPATMLPLK